MRGREADVVRDVGWRERDWAKFTDAERRALYGGGSGGLPPSDEGAAHRSWHDGPSTPPPSRSVGARRGRVGEWALAVLVALGVGASAKHALFPTNRTGPAISSPRPNSLIRATPENVVPIRWRTTDIRPALRPGRICVTDSRYGRICAIYAVGERPAETLTHQIERLGLQVRSNY